MSARKPVFSPATTAGRSHMITFHLLCSRLHDNTTRVLISFYLPTSRLSAFVSSPPTWMAQLIKLSVLSRHDNPSILDLFRELQHNAFSNRIRMCVFAQKDSKNFFIDVLSKVEFKENIAVHCPKTSECLCHPADSGGLPPTNLLYRRSTSPPPANGLFQFPAQTSEQSPISHYT